MTESMDHDKLQLYYEEWLNNEPRFYYLDHTYHKLLDNRMISEKHFQSLINQNHDPAALVLRGIPDLFVTDLINNISFYLEFKGQNTKYIESTALSYQYCLVKMGVKVIYINDIDKGFLLTSECIDGIHTIYYHKDLFKTKSEEEKQHKFIRNSLKQDISFIPVMANGNSKDPYVRVSDLLQNVFITDPKFLMCNLDIYD